MKKLFDETNGHESKYYRTIWYGYYEGSLDESLKDKMINLVKHDLDNAPTENSIESTSWVFYDKNEQKDAISDTVRASLMIRHWKGAFVANFNMSDFQFVTALDAIEEFKSSVVNELNNK